MKMTKVFVDGSSGTTGLKIVDRLSKRSDIELIKLSDELRKDVNAKKDAINSADVVFLCLPDAAAIESVSLVENKNVCVIDTSTAHRTNDKFAYGFAEVNDLRSKIQSSNLIANPGCHASGFISLVAPLVRAGLINTDIKLSCFSLTGYTGGGKKMIAQYEEGCNVDLEAPRQYGLTQMHKHLPEMTKVCGIDNAPIFCPIVAPFAQGMEVTVPLFKSDLRGNIKDIIELYKSVYTTKLVHFDEANEEGFLTSNKYANYDDMGVSVYGNDDRIILVSRFDNLGKGASGAAIQNMNIHLGLKEEESLNIKGAN
ncbi:MAG: N-acetyl-gamma-glutamyl-phosphate reductase [Clostridiales bacterium]|nr:N-acetyl-gamma-glutamyl-phosphate reductase [Clostridiales bacterium]